MTGDLVKVGFFSGEKLNFLALIIGEFKSSNTFSSIIRGNAVILRIWLGFVVFEGPFGFIFRLYYKIFLTGWKWMISFLCTWLTVKLSKRKLSKSKLKSQYILTLKKSTLQIHSLYALPVLKIFFPLAPYITKFALTGNCLTWPHDINKTKENRISLIPGQIY